MDSSITLEHVVTVGGFLIALIGMGFGFWKYFEGKIERTRSDANLAVGAVKMKVDENAKELATYQRHVAESYVTKAGMQEQTMQILKAIDGMSGKLDHLNGRIDGLMKPASTRTPRSN
jgi:hypothetical protein